MITLQDAIERAKLATDDEGILSSYTYKRLVEELSFEDRHAFTMALVDLGIITKHGSEEDVEYMMKVLGIKDEEAFKEANRQIDIIEEFVKISQQFVQDSGGFWAPDIMEDSEVPELDDSELNFDEDPFIQEEFDKPVDLEFDES